MIARRSCKPIPRISLWKHCHCFKSLHVGFRNFDAKFLFWVLRTENALSTTSSSEKTDLATRILFDRPTHPSHEPHTWLVQL